MHKVEYYSIKKMSKCFKKLAQLAACLETNSLTFNVQIFGLITLSGRYVVGSAV